MAVIGALIYKIQADVADVVKNTSEVSASLGRMEGAAQRAGRAFQTFAGALGLSFSVGSVVQLGRATLAYADSLGELALGASVSVEALQGLGYAAAQNGASVERMAQTLQELGERLGSGDTAVVGAVRRLGLNFEEIRRSSPDTAFRAIAAALRSVEDANTRNALAADTLGKSWKQLMPTVLSSIEDLERAAPRLSQAQVEALGTAQDAWDSFGLHVKVNTGRIIAHIQEIQKVRLFNVNDAREQIARDLRASMPDVQAPAGFDAASSLPGIDLGAAERAMKRQEDTARQMARAASESAEEWNRAFASMQRETEQKTAAIVAAMMRQKDRLNDLTATIMQQVAEMNARQGLTMGGQVVPQGAAGKAYAVEQQYQDRLTEIGRMRARLPDQDPNSYMQRQIDALLTDAWAQYQDALYALGEGSTGAAESSAVLGSAMGGAADSAAGFSRAMSAAIPELMQSLSRATTAGMPGGVVGSLAGSSGVIAANPAGMPTGDGDQIPIFGASGFLGYRRIGSFATGGYAPGPTLAIVGDSPGGETMIPGRVRGGVTIHAPVTVNAQGASFQTPQSIAALARQTADALADKLRSQGRLL